MLIIKFLQNRLNYSNNNSLDNMRIYIISEFTLRITYNN